MESDLLTVPEAAHLLGISPETLYRMIRRGDFPPAIKIGKTLVRLSAPRLVEYLHGDAAARKDPP
jgi:excisionase family DNA binding protein